MAPERSRLGGPLDPFGSTHIPGVRRRIAKGREPPRWAEGCAAVCGKLFMHNTHGDLDCNCAADRCARERTMPERGTVVYEKRLQHIGYYGPACTPCEGCVRGGMCDQGLANGGAQCWLGYVGPGCEWGGCEGGCEQGPCPSHCGTGLCCRKGFVGGGCDGKIGKDDMHTCTSGMNTSDPAIRRTTPYQTAVPLPRKPRLPKERRPEFPAAVSHGLSDAPACPLPGGCD